ncbi:MAG: hypothetical protein Q7J34_12540 [Bacteroidales bacterium]|nr:hypothetical protein [Bacteroidales bacterium]
MKNLFKKSFIHLTIIGLFILFLPLNSHSQNIHYGVLAMSGGRYDDLRMCVASAAGVKGGPIADIMFSIKRTISPDQSLIINIPFMRPILFAAAFDMLQFEPEVAYLWEHPSASGRIWFSGPGMGISLNYGPDYTSDLNNRGESFFSAGPMFQYQAGMKFTESKRSSLAFKVFYIPLFSSKGFNNGTVLGGNIQYSYYF